jgi:hypothetical protein
LVTGKEAIQRKLNTDILPQLLSAEQLPRNWRYWLYRVNAYGSELAALMVGVGLSSNMTNVMVGKPFDFKSDELSVSLGLAAALFWIVMKLVVNQEDLVKKGTAIRSSQKELKKIRMDLHVALSQSNPMPALTAAQVAVSAIVTRLNGEDAWPWPGNDPSVEPVVRIQSDEYYTKFSPTWTEVPETVQN